MWLVVPFSSRYIYVHRYTRTCMCKSWSCLYEITAYILCIYHIYLQYSTSMCLHACELESGGTLSTSLNVYYSSCSYVIIASRLSSSLCYNASPCLLRPSSPMIQHVGHTGQSQRFPLPAWHNPCRLPIYPHEDLKRDTTSKRICLLPSFIIPKWATCS